MNVTTERSATFYPMGSNDPDCCQSYEETAKAHAGSLSYKTTQMSFMADAWFSNLAVYVQNSKGEAVLISNNSGLTPKRLKPESNIFKIWAAGGFDLDGNKPDNPTTSLKSVALVEKAAALYKGILRRDREPYIHHVVRVARKVPEYLYRCALLHDALELGLPVTIDDLTKQFGLLDWEVKILDILTAQKGESSNDHFERVLSSNNIDALMIKRADCKDNAIMQYPFDTIWYEKKLGKSALAESNKYRERAKRIKDFINSKAGSLSAEELERLRLYTETRELCGADPESFKLTNV